MTSAAGPEQQTSADAVRPTLESAPGGLTLLPPPDGADAGLCIGGVCRLPGAKG